MAHIHEVIDSDKCFTIDPITRLIVNDAGNKKTQLIQNDHNSERFAFQLPRYIEGHDMSLSNKVEVHYINLDQSSNERSVGVYEVTDLALSEDNESVLLSWLISNNATKYVGVLSFAICFKCMSDNVIDYSWNTAINSSIQIAKGMYNSEIITKDYIDVLEAWKEEFGLKLSGEYLTKSNPEGTGSFSMNRIEGSDVGTNSVTLGTGCIASGPSCYAEGLYTIAGNYERLDVSTTTSVQIDSKNMICLSIPFDKEVFPISVGDSIIIIFGIVMDITTSNIEYKNITTIVQSITEPDPSTEIKEYKIYIDENEILNSGTNFETTQAFVILYKKQNQSSGGAGPMSNIGCHAEGKYTTASGDSSHAEGLYTTASGDYGSHAEGDSTTASGENSHAEGVHTTASGDYGSHAEGEYATASGPVSHAEGYYTTASGESSHAEGDNTTASGENSHAEGFKTTASGYASHAEGEYTKASSKYAHVEGYHTTARANSQHVQGKYNVEDTNGTYAHIVGGGTSNTNRKNIHTLDWNGNAVYSGDVNATDADGNTVSLLGTKWKLKGNVVNNNTISLPDNYTELKVMSYKTDQEYPIAYTQTILKDMIDAINKDTMQLYCGNTQQYGASWSINKSAKTIQLTNIENTTQVNNCATYLYYR